MFLCCRFWGFLCSLLVLNMLGFISAVYSETNPENATQGHNVSKVDPEAIRLHTARLLSHLRSMFVSQEKVPPYVATADGRVEVNIEMSAALMSVLRLDDVGKTLSTNVLIKLSWTDTALSWNASQYGGVSSVQLSVRDLWTPNIYIFNSPDKNMLLTDTDFLTVMSEGKLFAYKDLILQSFCNTDLDKYPFDTQTCTMNFHSKLWPIVRISFHGLYVTNTTELFSYSSEWLLKNKQIILVKGGFLDEPMPAISIEISRRTLFYVTCLVMPIVMTSFMNTLVFLVPLHSGEKISFLVTIFVSISVFISFFTDVMPRGLHNVPATLKLLMGVMVQSLLVLLTTLFLVHLEQAHGSPTQSETQPQSWEAREDRSGSKPVSERKTRAPCSTQLSVLCGQPADLVKASVGDSAALTPTPSPSPSSPGREARCLNFFQRLTPNGRDRALFFLASVVNLAFLCFLWYDTM